MNPISRKIKKLIMYAILFLVFPFLQYEAKTFRNNSINQDSIRAQQQDPYYLSDKRTLEKFTGIPSLEDGFDSFQLRVHYRLPFSNKVQLISIGNKSGMWAADLYDLKMKTVISSDSLSYNVIDYNIDNHSGKKPISGWSKFMKKFFQTGILELPNGEQLAGYDGCYDGAALTVEIATVHQYRILHFRCFEIGEDPAAKKVEKILQFLEHEFSFSRTRSSVRNG